MSVNGKLSFEDIARAVPRGDEEILDEEEEARRRETPSKKIQWRRSHGCPFSDEGGL